MFLRGEKFFSLTDNDKIDIKRLLLIGYWENKCWIFPIFKCAHFIFRSLGSISTTAALLLYTENELLAVECLIRRRDL